LAHKVLYDHFSGATEINHEDHTSQQIVKPITSHIQSMRVLASTPWDLSDKNVVGLHSATAQAGVIILL